MVFKYNIFLCVCVCLCVHARLHVFDTAALAMLCKMQLDTPRKPHERTSHRLLASEVFTLILSPLRTVVLNDDEKTASSV